ncbi:isochorismate synthase [Pseudogemmobacter bohemicus]|uniref:isochorismate synthase n=1 Tax=Pseudogemmobacter bohemicus TaxID=2250708 RepID=UPI000DD330F6|nr:isochorismate synthase [Pseudogemmobacter bohemicus]
MTIPACATALGITTVAAALMPSDAALAAKAPDFLISGPHHALALGPARRHLPAGPLDGLAARAAAFFAAGHDGPQLLAGAVPYHREAADCLFQPGTLVAMPPGSGAIPAAPRAALRIRAEPPARHYRDAVSAAVARIAAGEFSKIVLSRSLVLSADTPHDPEALFSMMRRDGLATLFSVPLRPRAPGRPRRLIGATPELLVEKRGSLVASHPLAGSARRATDPQSDRAAGEALLRSDKDRREHAMAAEMVLDTLVPFCATLAAPDGVTLSATARMWHLGTRIEGVLRDPATPCADLLAALHPTPAVCGLPRAAAEAALPELEGYARDFYAGAVGWLEANGDGCWYLALRCAEIEGTEARLYAGAGIVLGSDPEAEEAETGAKFLAMLAAFGQDSDGKIGE